VIEATAKHENVDIPVYMADWEEIHGITLCCITLNEEKEIKEFIEYHRPYVDKVVMVDGGSKDRTVEIASPLVDDLIIRKFDGHYSNQANRCTERAKTDWIFLVDCDERAEIGLLKNLRNLINQEEVDCWGIPRKNYIDGAYDPEHFPDYQERLYRTYCRRIRPVHGEVVGYKKRRDLPCEDGNYFIHSKTSERHKLRNKLYSIYEMKYINEMGEPETQNKEKFYKKYPHLSKSNFIIR